LVPAAAAQRTGVLDPSIPRGQRKFGAEIALASLDSEGIDRFARLLLNLSDAGSAGSSTWKISVTSSNTGGEVGINVNLTDVVASVPGLKRFSLVADPLSAFRLSLLGPINARGPFTELADLNGLVGVARGELAYTHRLATVNFATPSLSLDVSGALPTFTFAEAATLARDTLRHRLFSAGVGLVFKNGTNFARLGYRYQNLYKANPEKPVCTPASFGPPGTSTCESLSIGAPNHSTKHAGELEVRYSFKQYVTANAQVSHDFQNSMTGVDVPVLFIPDAKSGLGGGVRFGYRTDTHRPTASIFVGVFKV
jgi:hypothetical protein